ncbi:MAG TPA: hypothetical protein VK908_09825 [Jiangellales bacterium]|nr:hypothetical protein [Jiangellales bacterium]
MHNFTVIPLRSGAKVLVSSAYTGRTTVVDVDMLLAGAKKSRGRLCRPHGGNAWSSYWHNGHIYANNIVRGLDVSLPSDSERGGALKLDQLNPQTQINTVG